jgi:hypothetical protein
MEFCLTPCRRQSKEGQGRDALSPSLSIRLSVFFEIIEIKAKKQAKNNSHTVLF